MAGGGGGPSAARPRDRAQHLGGEEEVELGGGMAGEMELGSMASSDAWLRELMEPPDLRPGQANDSDEIVPGLFLGNSTAARVAAGPRSSVNGAVNCAVAEGTPGSIDGTPCYDADGDSQRLGSIPRLPPGCSRPAFLIEPISISAGRDGRAGRPERAHDLGRPRAIFVAAARERLGYFEFAMTDGSNSSWH